MALTPRIRALRWSFVSAVALLLLVYVLGMSLNLGFGSFALLMNIHMTIATLVLLAGLLAVILSLLERHVWGGVAAGAGALFTLVAFAGGGSFIQSGQDAASMVMALGYIGALLSFGLGVYSVRR